MRITADSHTDHSLAVEHWDFVMATFGDREAFFVETVELPVHLPALKCGLYGPMMGDAAVPDRVCEMRRRGSREYTSRMCPMPPRETRQLTVVGGPHKGECILYTAFGGPPTIKEPGDPTLKDDDRADSVAFWATHALADTERRKVVFDATYACDGATGREYIGGWTIRTQNGGRLTERYWAERGEASSVAALAEYLGAEVEWRSQSGDEEEASW